MNALHKLIPQLPVEVLASEFRCIEKGAIAFIQSQPTKETEAVCTAAARAYQRIFVSTVPMIRNLALVGEVRRRLGLEDEYFQEGCLEVMDQILALGAHNKDISDRCKYFYATCSRQVKYRIQDINSKVFQNQFAIHESEFRLSRTAVLVEAELRRTLQREPTRQELANTIGVSQKELGAVIRKTTNDVLPIDEYTNVIADSFDIDANIETMYWDDVLDQLFAEGVLSDNEKIALSLYYGYYSSHLCGAEFSIQSHSGRSNFCYPYSKEDFYELLSDKKEESPRTVGQVVHYDRVKIGHIVRTALKTSRALLEEMGIDEL